MTRSRQRKPRRGKKSPERPSLRLIMAKLGRIAGDSPRPSGAVPRQQGPERDTVKTGSPAAEVILM